MIPFALPCKLCHKTRRKEDLKGSPLFCFIHLPPTFSRPSNSAAVAPFLPRLSGPGIVSFQEDEVRTFRVGWVGAPGRAGSGTNDKGRVWMACWGSRGPYYCIAHSNTAAAGVRDGVGSSRGTEECRVLDTVLLYCIKAHKTGFILSLRITTLKVAGCIGVNGVSLDFARLIITGLPAL